MRINKGRISGTRFYRRVGDGTLPSRHAQLTPPTLPITLPLAHYLFNWLQLRRQRSLGTDVTSILSFSSAVFI
jgi:hypothetical protein